MAAAAAAAAAYQPPAGSRRMVIDLRVTKETIQILHFSSLALELQNYAEWSLSRNQVPYALARKGITLHDWSNIFDRADALWERRTMEAIEVDRERNDRKKSRSCYMIAFYLVTFGLLGAMITLGIIFGETWMVGLGFCTLVVVPIVVCVLLTKYDFKHLDETHFVNKANMEHDWMLLANEQRCKFESLGVDVEPAREDHSIKKGNSVLIFVMFLLKMFGKDDFTITDGLRFIFDQDEQHMQSATNSESSLPMLSNGLMIPDAVIHDLNRLLQLNQTEDVRTEEYQLLKLRILSRMSLPFQYVSLPRNHGARPVPSIAVMTTVKADTGAVDERQGFMEIV